MIQPPTYPARPLNGGALELARSKRGDWRVEPKYNGWRAVVHIPTGAMFNRQLEPLSIALEFRHALASLRSRFPLLAWADCEALSRRHALGKGALILLDIIDGEGWPYLARRNVMIQSGCPILQVREWPEPDALYLAPSLISEQGLWDALKLANTEAGCDFYEGIVCKRADKPYPMQRISATRETADWIKHRWPS